MIYKVIMKKMQGPTLSYYTQVWWVNIDVPSNDEKLEEKILFGLKYNKYPTLKEHEDVGYGGVTIEVIPFPEYPGLGTAQSDLLDLNNSVSVFTNDSIQETVSSEEQYVSFETAKILKKKGFNIPCWHYYHTSKLEHYFRKVTNKGWATSGNISAPSQSLTMKWLREVYDIDIIIGPHKEVNTWVYQSHLCKNREYLFSMEFGDTYESCVEAAIQYCLEHLI